MKQYRLNRLLHSGSGRCLAVAADHPIHHERSFINGLEDMEKVIDLLIQAGPDALLLSPGQAGLLQRRAGRQKPALIMRADLANVYAPELPSTCYSRMYQNAVEQALHLDAACVVVNLLHIPEAPEVTRDCIDNILRLRPECDRYSMPMMVEALAFRPGRSPGGLQSDTRLDAVLAIVRQAVDLGADIIKADPSEDVAAFHQVVKVARVPVLVRGGSKGSENEVLERTRTLVAQDAAGIVYGRNVFQHENPAAMLQALMKLIHG